ncbi:S9 family peptidase [Pedobacter sp. SYSU D00535]|uniref:alpha/beta hydrolase family protein n=1 Tax=Pedobacter sp. SYSU D00535 TaxID=2810308 RepID=UPI001A974643|nr:hypothetical protein [Pedobacter sp. SYSU D00535]
MSRFLSILLVLLASTTVGSANSGKWLSKTTNQEITYTAKEARRPSKDFVGNYATIVYLTNLGFTKVGRNSNVDDIRWLGEQGYRVIVLDYSGHADAVSPKINADIVAINDSIAAGEFCGYRNCSKNLSYVLFEGYRIARNVGFFKDDPKVYNTPEQYIEGDTLKMDIVYPANPSVSVPIILSFSYSNSYATYDSEKKTLTDANKAQRLNLQYTLAGFNDSFLEGAPASGMAWAIADHPKYCPWGKGKPINGPNDTYKSFQTNPDAVRKVKSAVRTLRKVGTSLGLSDRIGIFGFSRGSTAGALAIGDKVVPEFENAGFYLEASDEVQAAALGPGVFDFTKIYTTKGDGDTNLEVRCPWAWGPLEENQAKWESMGASHLIESSATAPVLLFYNTDDELYYQDQLAHLKKKLDSKKIPNQTLKDYGRGHSLPESTESLNALYSFFRNHLLGTKSN